MKSEREITDIIKQCKFKEWGVSLRYKSTTPYLQVHFYAQDAFSNEDKYDLQASRKWMLSEHMTTSEIVHTIYAAIERAMLHELKDNFRYKGKAIFTTHRDVNMLAEIASKESVDIRAPMIDGSF